MAMALNRITKVDGSRRLNGKLCANNAAVITFCGYISCWIIFMANSGTRSLKTSK